MCFSDSQRLVMPQSLSDTRPVLRLRLTYHTLSAEADLPRERVVDDDGRQGLLLERPTGRRRVYTDGGRGGVSVRGVSQGKLRQCQISVRVSVRVSVKCQWVSVLKSVSVLVSELESVSVSVLVSASELESVS